MRSSDSAGCARSHSTASSTDRSNREVVTRVSGIGPEEVTAIVSEFCRAAVTGQVTGNLARTSRSLRRSVGVARGARDRSCVWSESLREEDHIAVRVLDTELAHPVELVLQLHDDAGAAADRGEHRVDAARAGVGLERDEQRVAAADRAGRK